MAGKYREKSQRTVHEALRKYKHGELKSGRSEKKVSGREQAIAIGLSEARKKGPRCRGNRTAESKFLPQFAMKTPVLQ
jgi:hypothetical protein